MEASENMNYNLIEDLLEYPDELSRRFEQSLEEVGNSNFGFELDCDSIANFPSSAKSPSGFSEDQIRNLIHLAANNGNCVISIFVKLHQLTQMLPRLVKLYLILLVILSASNQEF